MNNNQKKNYTQKKWYMEWLRVISMTAVVFTHIGATAHTDFPDTYYANIGGGSTSRNSLSLTFRSSYFFHDHRCFVA